MRLGLVAWFGSAYPIEAPLVVIVALVAAATGFPLGAVRALLAAVADYVSRSQHGAGDPLVGALWSWSRCVVVSALFYGEISPIEESSEVAPGQLAFRPARVRRFRAVRQNGSAMSTSLAALASGIREVSQGDFTKNIAVSDGQLQDLAIALNKLIFGMREFLRATTRKCGQLGQRRRRTAHDGVDGARRH